MPDRKGHFAPQNTFLDTIATRFDGTHSNFILGSAQTPGVFPIVYCSDGFCELTGFSRGNLMQRCCSCPFLYGDDTDRLDQVRIMIALQQQQEFQTKLVLYKKNKEPFYCLLDVVPIKDDKNGVVMFLVTHKDIPFPCDVAGSDISNLSCSSSSSIDSNHSLQKIPSKCKELGHRRRSRAVLYNLSENLEAKKKKRNKGYLQTITSQLCGKRKNGWPQYKMTNSTPSSWTILHFSTKKTIWDWIVMLVTIYVTAMVPYYAAVESVDETQWNATADSYQSFANSEVTAVIDIIVEVIFIVDIVLTFLTTYVSKSGWVIADPRKIVINYLSSWFIVDLIAAVPVDILSHIVYFKHASAKPITLLKTVRFLRLLRLFHKVDRWTQYSAVLLTILMIMFGLMAHWLACIWFALGWGELRNKGITEIGWLYELSEALHEPFYSNGTGGPGVTSSYITSLYFTLSSLTSVGFGNVSANTNAEKIFSICVMTIGALMHAVVFGNVTAIIQRMYAKRSQYDVKMRDLKDFIKIHRLSKSTKRRMIEHFQSTWQMNGGVNANKVLRDFPKDIQADVAVQLYKDVLNVPAFLKGTEGFRRNLSLHIHRMKCSPAEYVIYDGDPLQYVMYVCKGSLEILRNDLVIGILGKGDLFGADVGVPRDQIMTSQADVKALAFCELECVSLKGIYDVTELYPEFAPIFLNDMRSDLSFNLWHCLFGPQDRDCFDESENNEENEEEVNDIHLVKKWMKSTDACQGMRDLEKEEQNQTDDNCIYSSEDDLVDVSETTSLFENVVGNQANPSSVENTSSRVATSETTNSLRKGLSSSHPSLHTVSEMENGQVLNSFDSPIHEKSENNFEGHSSAVDFSTYAESSERCLKNEHPSKLSVLVGSFSSAFGNKSNKDNNFDENKLSPSSNTSLLSRPSCFKKSLISLHSVHSQHSGISDASSVTKRVTFCEDSTRKSPASKRSSRRSLSIPGDSSINMSTLSTKANDSLRRFSDVGVTSPFRNLRCNREAVEYNFIHTDGNSLDDVERTTTSFQNAAQDRSSVNPDNKNTESRSSLSKLADSNSSFATDPTSLHKGVPGSPQRGGTTKRRRRQRRKSNSPTSSSQISRRPSTTEESLSDGSAYTCRNNSPQRDVSLGSPKSRGRQERRRSADPQEVISIEEYYVDRLIALSAKMVSINEEVQTLVKEIKESMKRKHSSNNINWPSEVKRKSEPQNEMDVHTSPKRLHHSGNSSSSNKVISTKFCSPSKRITDSNKSFHEVPPHNQTLSNSNSDTYCDVSRPLPLCTVTAPTGETQQILIESSKSANSFINSTPRFDKPKFLATPSSNTSFRKNFSQELSNSSDALSNYARLNKFSKNYDDNPSAVKRESDYLLKNHSKDIGFREEDGDDTNEKLVRFPSSSSLGSVSSFASFNRASSRKSSVQDEDYYNEAENCQDSNGNTQETENVFYPITVPPQSSCLSDVDFDICKTRLANNNNPAKGNESGYISTSPTIQLRE